MLLEHKSCIVFLSCQYNTKRNERMNKLIGKPESKLFMGMAMSSVPRAARAESSVQGNDGAGLVRRISLLNL